MNVTPLQAELRTAAAVSPTCKRCGNTTFERMQRVGFLQRKLMPFFNLYPWRCAICNKLTYRTARNRVELHKQSQSM